jgi:diaminohydroxyphosphoribosylaminopyrimidine deaminase/5-amino-6-(5-phosphoribosylamino)uracil reductase
MSNDQQFMRRALELAQKGAGLTRPNPPVGAVLILNGKIISEGWHQKAGKPHAEVECLKTVSGSLKEATLYVTLEPCSTHGRTPPCTDLILEKGVGRVVIATPDLNPKHAGRGIKILRDAGVEVICPVCEKEAKELIAPFEKRITTGLPFLTLKLGITLDGRIADQSGASKWITGAEARERVQQMRRQADAILVGAGTVRADNPSLLPRPADGRAPWRVIIGKNIPADSKVCTDEAASRTLLREGDLKTILQNLAAEHDVMHVLCEGGGKLAAALAEAGLVDRYAFFIAPRILGADGLPSFCRTGFGIQNTLNLKFESIEHLGEDLLIYAKEKK